MYVSSITLEQIEGMEYAAFPGEIHVIEEEGAEFFRAVTYLSRQKVIGFDTETRPCFTSSQPQ